MNLPLQKAIALLSRPEDSGHFEDSCYLSLPGVANTRQPITKVAVLYMAVSQGLCLNRVPQCWQHLYRRGHTEFVRSTANQTSSTTGASTCTSRRIPDR
jgi:hypothetical protein